MTHKSYRDTRNNKCIITRRYQ